MSALAAVDIGGTNVKVGLVRGGEILDSDSITVSNYESAVPLLRDVSQLIKTMANCLGVRIAGVGVASAGLVDRALGTIIESPNIPFLSGCELSSVFASELSVPVSLENDASAACLAEYLYGGWERPQVLLTLTLGTGVGGGAVIGGVPLWGSSFMAAEFGHIKTRGAGDRKCGCGQRGCIEAYVGTEGILTTAREILRTRRPPVLDASSDARPSGSSPWPDVASLARAAAAKDPIAIETFFRAGKVLGGGIATLIDVFNPDLIVLSGGIAQAFIHLKNGIHYGTKEFCSFEATQDIAKIVPSSRPTNSGLLGAAAAVDWRSEMSNSGKIRRKDSGAADTLPILALHVGASSYSAGVVTAAGEIKNYERIRSSKARVKQPYAEFLEEMTAIAMNVIDDSEMAADIAACGVVVPVPVPLPVPVPTQATGTSWEVGWAPALEELRGKALAVDLGSRLHELLGREIPVVLENDGNGMALAEAYFGAASNVSDFLVVRLCTGIGGGIFTKGKLNRGANGLAGEIGHQRLDPYGERCGCGGIGCLETLTSGRILLERAVSQTSQEFRHYIDVVDAALNGEIALEQEFTKMGQYLGRAISGIINLLDVELVVLGGPISRAYSMFEDTLKQEVYTFPQTNCEIIPSKLDRGEALAALASIKYHQPNLLEKKTWQATPAPNKQKSP